VAEAARIATSYASAVTLRQLFYRLVSPGVIPNQQSYYRRLSEYTAQARRDGWFPDLLDQGRSIIEPVTFADPDEAHEWLRYTYRTDRTAGQEYQIWLAGEKRTLIEQLDEWFGNFGVPIIVLSGYSSQTLADQVSRRVSEDGRPAVLIYAGDLDSSGEDIDRSWVERTHHCWKHVDRIAVNAEQVERFGLIEQPGKPGDPRAAGFVRRHGRLFQVEVEALDPNDLRDLYRNAFSEWWDPGAYDNALIREEAERSRL
jgi:hypothetical protein